MKKMMNVLSAAAVMSTLFLSGCVTESKAQPSTGAVSQTKAASIQTKESMIPSLDAGIQLYLKEKSAPRAKEAVLFLEPFGVPTAQAFDIPGYSWMDHLSEKGYATFALDFRGFGKSTRPDAMSKPPLDNQPVVRATDAIKDVDATVQYIKKQKQVDKVTIIGWSWGGVVAGMYAAEHPKQVNKLVLYGSMHNFSLPFMTQPLEEKPGVLKKKLPAYQLAEPQMTMHHWHMMMKDKQLASADAMEKVSATFLRADETSQKRTPPSIRRAMGPMIDLYSIWSNKPIFDAAKIQAPTLVVRGDADFFADPDYMKKLSGAKVKKEIVVKDGTHWLLYEKNRNQLLDATDAFLAGK